MKEKLSEEALENLKQVFESRDILEAVDCLDSVRGTICNPDQLRKELTHLHERAMDLTYHGNLEIPSDDDCIGDLAVDIEFSVEGCIEKLEKILTLIKPLTELLTDPDDDE